MTMSDEEARTTANLALGRIFRLMSRPFQDGDVQQYLAARGAFLDAMEALGIQARYTGEHSFIVNRRRGAQGD